MHLSLLGCNSLGERSQILWECHSSQLQIRLSCVWVVLLEDTVLCVVWVRRCVLGVLEVCYNGCISCCLPVAMQYALTSSCECALVCCVRKDRWERIERVEVCVKCMMCLCLFLTLILVRAYPIGWTKHLIPPKLRVVAPRCYSRGFDRFMAHASPIRQNTLFTNTYASASTVCAELSTLRGLWRQSFRKKEGQDVNSQFIRIWRRGWWYNKVLTEYISTITQHKHQDEHSRDSGIPLQLLRFSSLYSPLGSLASGPRP